MNLSEQLLTYVEGLAEDNYFKYVSDKMSLESYKTWENFLEKSSTERFKLMPETTGENLCYTAFVTNFEKSEKYSRSDTIYLHKNIHKDFFTLYVKSRVIFFIDGKPIRYPEIIFVSPVGHFDHILLEIRDLVLETYPNAKFIPFYKLEDQRSSSFLDRRNYYEFLFGYEGDILRNKLAGDLYFSYNR